MTEDERKTGGPRTYWSLQLFVLDRWRPRDAHGSDNSRLFEFNYREDEVENLKEW